MVRAGSRIKLLVVAAKYVRDYSLLNNMVFGLNPDRFDVKVCYLTGKPDGKNSLDSLGAIYLEQEDSSVVGSRKKTIQWLIKLFKRDRPDIVHCHRHKATVLAAIAARMAAVPAVVSHDHGTGIKRLRNPRRRMVTRLVYRWVDRVITVSERGREDILTTNPSLPPSSVLTIWNGIDLDRFDRTESAKGDIKEKMGVGPDDLVFGTVGRLAEKKGHSYLLDSFARVLEKLPSSRLVIVGDGHLLGELTDKAESLGISPSVKLLGYRNDVPELLSGFDVLVFPSFSEGLPLALLEGMASRLPAVVSDGRGMPEVYGPGGFGRMVKAGDIEGFASAMIELGGMTEKQRLQLAEAARERVRDEFSKESMCRALMEVYESVLAG